jgi:hypothetical protein
MRLSCRSFRLPAWTVGRGGGRRLVRLLNGFRSVAFADALKHVTPFRANNNQFVRVREMLAKQAATIASIAKETGLTRQTIYRIKDDPAAAEAALSSWGL